MDIASILPPNCILFNQRYTSKKRILEAVTSHLCDQYSFLDSNNVFSALIARERLGSTGIGLGIAMPHCRISDCDKALGLLVTLNQAVDFDAIDNKPVDIVFVLIVPDGKEQDHLKTLATIAEVFSREEIQKAMRGAESSEALYKIITKKVDQ